MDPTTSRPGGDQNPPAAAGGGAAIAAIVVPARFNGPPGGANGGWISGTLAGYLEDRAGSGVVAQAVLRALTPLETPLAVVPAGGGGVALVRGDTLLVEAHAVTGAGPGEPPPFVGLAEAERAGGAVAAAAAHPFPGCFGCGLGRAAGDGLRILPGQVAGGPPGLVATTWTVDRSLAEPGTGAGTAGGALGRPLVWAALDCPSFWAHQAARPTDDLAALLARQTVAVAPGAVVAPGETYVVVASADSVDGRKLRSSCALYTTDGRLVASASSLWIRIPSVGRAAS